MMENYEILYGVSSVLFFICQTVIFIFSILYSLKFKSTDGVLMVVGSLLLLIVMISQPIISSVFMINKNPEDMISIQGILSIASGIFGIIFAIGFAMAILKLKKIEKP